MIAEKNVQLPRSLEEFKNWEFEDKNKYEWFNGELVVFHGMRQTELYIYQNITRTFANLNLWKSGLFVSRQTVEFSDDQIRLPDITYFTNKQSEKMRNGSDEIPEFAIEVISKAIF